MAEKDHLYLSLIICNAMRDARMRNAMLGCDARMRCAMLGCYARCYIASLKKPTEQNINALKKYCIIFDKDKKMAKESYFNLELELNKNNLKKTWEILRQAIHKQNNPLPFLIHLS